jgi:hypothetical protein
VRELLTRRTRIGLEIADGGHHEARHAEGTLEALALHDGLLHGVQCAIRLGEAFDADDLLPPDAMRQDRAGIVRHIVHQHGARAAFGAIASELGAGETQFVAQGHRQRFVLQHVNAPLLAVDVERDQTLDRAGHAVVLADDRGAEQIRGRGDRCAGGDYAFDEIASRMSRLNYRSIRQVLLTHRAFPQDGHTYTCRVRMIAPLVAPEYAATGRVSYS